MSIDGACPRILICRLSALGDCIHTLPILCALRRHWPQAHIGWLTQKGCEPLLTGHAALDEVITVPKGFLKRPSALLKLRRDLKSRRFELALDVQSLTKSALPAWLSGAKRRVAFAAPSGRELAPLLATEKVKPTALHVVDQNLEMLTPLGVPSQAVEFNLPHDVIAEHRINQFLLDHYLTERIAVIHPAAGWDSKIWLPQRYAEVASHLGHLHGVTTVVAWAGDRVKRWAEEIVDHANGQAILAPATSLPELVALLRRASLYIGSDSGPLHMAAAIGTPCAALFGPTRPERNGPYGAGHRVVQRFFQGGTTRSRKQADNEAMRAIETADVVAAVNALIEEHGLNRREAA